MKKEDFYGKYYLRSGDLLPELIGEWTFKGLKFNIGFLERLDKDGLLFANKRDAECASTNLRMIGRGINDHTIMREEDILEAPAKPRIYISGPISGHNIEERRKAFTITQTFLEAQGYEVVNPMENGLPAEATTHEHMKRDIEQLMTCDYIYMMRRWTHSKGCKVEFDVATAIGLPVFFEESGKITNFE